MKVPKIPGNSNASQNGGGFQNLWFSPLLGETIPILASRSFNVFAWFNHQLVNYSSFWRGKPQKSRNSEILWPLHCQVNWSLVLYISFVWTKMALARRISSQHMAPWCGSRDLIKSTTRKGLRLSYCCMCLYIFKNQYHPSTFNLWYVSISLSVYCDAVCAITYTVLGCEYVQSTLRLISSMHGYVSSMQIHLHLNKTLSGDHTPYYPQSTKVAICFGQWSKWRDL